MLPNESPTPTANTKSETSGQKDSPTSVSPATKTRATLNLTVDEDFKWEVKEWATKHRMTVVDVMKSGFELMKEKHGK